MDAGQLVAMAVLTILAVTSLAYVMGKRMKLGTPIWSAVIVVWWFLAAWAIRDCPNSCAHYDFWAPLTVLFLIVVGPIATVVIVGGSIAQLKS